MNSMSAVQFQKAANVKCHHLTKSIAEIAAHIPDRTGGSRKDSHVPQFVRLVKPAANLLPLLCLTAVS